MRGEDWKKDKPCDSYVGNVCTGFGGKTICTFCGWDRFDHPPYKDLDAEIL